jgi:hypothetical protein
MLIFKRMHENGHYSFLKKYDVIQLFSPIFQTAYQVNLESQFAFTLL